MENHEGLIKYLNFITDTYGLSICINDFIGFLSEDNELCTALQPFLIHKNPFCMQVKSDRLLWDRCLAMKKGIRAKSQRLMRTYYGICYCGIGEYIVPILSDKYVIGVICAGEFNSHHRISAYRISKVSRESGMDKAVLLTKFEQSTTENLFEKDLIDKLLCIVSDYLGGIYRVLLKKGAKALKQNNMELNTETYVLSHAIEYIKQNYYEKVTVKDISDFCHCSISYISHLFKKKMKVNVKTYINQLRINQAKISLLNTDCSIVEIASQVGFYDPNYFSSVFRSICGLSPSEYREKGFIALK